MSKIQYIIVKMNTEIFARRITPRGACMSLSYICYKYIHIVGDYFDSKYSLSWWLIKLLKTFVFQIWSQKTTIFKKVIFSMLSFLSF